MADLPVVYESKDLLVQDTGNSIFPYFEEAIRSNIRESETQNYSKEIFTDVFFYSSQSDHSATMFFRVLTAKGAQTICKEENLSNGIYIEAYRPSYASCRLLLKIISEYVIHIQDDSYLLYFGDDMLTCCRVMSKYASDIYDETPSGLIGYETWEGLSIFKPIRRGGSYQMSKLKCMLDKFISNISMFFGK